MTINDLKTYIEGAITALRSVDIPMRDELGSDALFAYLLDIEGMLDGGQNIDHIRKVLQLMTGSVSIPASQFAKALLQKMEDPA